MFPSGSLNLAIRARQTRVPEPIDDAIKSSAASISYAAITVFRETPKSVAAARVEGNRDPAGNWPSRIARFSAV